ncbi:hypothetical protein Golomagni_03989 [Golovinomyces magnicellulatus]|nr:hypothetical protein Golomagni_03989 [Golovinomyces magnicellulatus]
MIECSSIPATNLSNKAHQERILTKNFAFSPNFGDEQTARTLNLTVSEGNENDSTFPTHIQLTKIQNQESAPNYSNAAPTASDVLSHQFPEQLQADKHACEMENRTTYSTQVTELLPPGNIDLADTVPQREKTKGVSLLSRLAIIRGKKKEPLEDPENGNEDNTSVECLNSHDFSSSASASGFIPHHKKPPRYIKVISRNKKQKIFDHMFLAQELSCSVQLNKEKNSSLPNLETGSSNISKLSEMPRTNAPIWAMEFSLDGRYLAAACWEHIVKVWEILSTPEERQAYEYDKDISSDIPGEERLNAPVFKSKPIREYIGHTGDILDIDWSKNNFLLTSALDKTVKLWHPSRQECLCTFSHDEIITSISFHPTDDRFFLAGSLDCILRLWSIPEKKVAFNCESPDPITAVAFTPSGTIAIAGGFSGLCRFYDVDQEHGLRVSDQIYVRSSRGKNAKGSKITGIRTTIFPPEIKDGNDVYVLVTSNDSRVRLYNLKDKRLEMKFQGHQNSYSQISARFSDDGRFVICGRSIKPKDSGQKEASPVETFNANSSIVTTALLAPAATRRLLSESDDPIYDICNPPPVTLLSLDEHSAWASVGSETRQNMMRNKTEASPAYFSRSSHNDGLIIITSDYAGSIKCFRIDCAFEKRHQWDASSIFSRKGSSIRRSNSSKTRTSTSSRYNSLEKFPIPTSIHSESILKWRGKVADGLALPLQKERNSSSEGFNLESCQSSPASNSIPTIDKNTEPEASFLPQRANTSHNVSHINGISRRFTLPPTPGFTLTHTLESEKNCHLSHQTTKFNLFWNINNWRTLSASREGSQDQDRLSSEKSYSKYKGKSNSGAKLSTVFSNSEEENQGDTRGIDRS